MTIIETINDLRSQIETIQNGRSVSSLKTTDSKSYYTIMNIKSKIKDLQNKMNNVQVVSNPMAELQRMFQGVNGITMGDRNSLHFQIWEEKIYTILTDSNCNEFMESLCKSVLKYMRVSEKQAYYLAAFVVKYNVEFN